MFIISTKFISPTNTKGARIRVKDHWTGESKIYPYSYIDDSDKTAILRYLEATFSAETIKNRDNNPLSLITQGGRNNPNERLWIINLPQSKSLAAEARRKEIYEQRRQQAGIVQA